RNGKHVGNFFKNAVSNIKKGYSIYVNNFRTLCFL
ncbi:LOW QUALITY PROTEIN: hypothetical protein TorRG33x02_152870, partial [Trema orientale]